MYTKHKKELYKYLADMERELKNLQDQEHNLEEREVDLEYAENDDYDDRDYNIGLEINEIQKELHELKIEVQEKELEILEHNSKIHAFEKSIAAKMKLPLTQLVTACKKHIDHLKPSLINALEALPRETKRRYLATEQPNPNDFITTETLNGKTHDINYTKIADHSNDPDFGQSDKTVLHQLRHTIQLYTALVTQKSPLENIEKEMQHALLTHETQKTTQPTKDSKSKTTKSNNRLFKEKPEKTATEKFYEKVTTTLKTLEAAVKDSFSNPSLKKTGSKKITTKRTSPKLSF